MKTKQCPDCHAENSSKAKRCGYCNYKFIQQPATIKHQIKTVGDDFSTETLLKQSIHQKLELISKKLDEFKKQNIILLESKNTLAEKYLKRIDEKLSNIIEKHNKRTWVKVGIVQDLTGWDREGLRKARRNNLVEIRKRGNSIEYCIESIPKIFIKNVALNEPEKS